MGASVALITASMAMLNSYCHKCSMSMEFCYLALLSWALGIFLGLIVEEIWSWADKQPLSRKHIWVMLSVAIIGWLILHYTCGDMLDLIGIFIVLGIFTMVVVELVIFDAITTSRNLKLQTLWNWIKLNVFSGRLLYRGSKLDSILNKFYKH